MRKKVLSAIAILSLSTAVAQNFFTPTCYRGAFAPAPTPMWTEGWTEWDPQNKTYPAPTMTVTGNITANTTWSTGQTVLISAQCFVINNAVLTIQPGVVILGDKNVTGAGLFITKGAKLMANGTAQSPIVFTSNQAPTQRAIGDWGGVILMGKAPNNIPGGVNNIEGLPISANTEYGVASGADPNDNSGSLQYVRIEFCGYAYQPNQEINGLTFGSVGRGTTIDHIQVSYSNDDAYEWFGGTVDCKYLVSYRNLDDDFDTDFGFGGRLQFGLAVRDPQIADNPSVSTSEFFESDNDPTGTSNTPVTAGMFSNFTCIGPLRGVPTATYATGHRSRARIRRNSALKIYNSVLLDQATRGLYIDGSASETNAMNNVLKFKNNILAGYGQRATESGTFGIINSNTFVIANGNDTLKSSANILVTPYNYTSPDYRPSSGSLALSKASFTDALLSAQASTVQTTAMATVPPSFCIGTTGNLSNPAMFVASTTLSPDYCGITWEAASGVAISNSTATTPSFTISTLGTFTVAMHVSTANGNTTVINSITTTTCTDVGIRNNGQLFTSAASLYPNPAGNSAVLSLNAANHDMLEISVFDITGKPAAPPVKVPVTAGHNAVNITTSNLSDGLYMVTASTGKSKETVKLIVNH